MRCQCDGGAEEHEVSIYLQLNYFHIFIVLLSLLLFCLTMQGYISRWRIHRYRLQRLSNVLDTSARVCLTFCTAASAGAG